ncbi:hypothetical protein V5O48_014257 [Marasmius crinis-equi]|uniref:Uncharacterized protein n=1 Tax=Marasmius crinis-equi TaxID=585013 RepID=A0ABR3EXU2_9AGAR
MGFSLLCSGIFAALNLPSLKSLQFSSWTVSKRTVFAEVPGEWPCKSFISFLQQRSTEAVLILKDNDDCHSCRTALASALAISPGSTVLVPHLNKLSVTFRGPITAPDHAMVERITQSRTIEHLEELSRDGDVSSMDAEIIWNDKTPIPNERKVDEMGEPFY